MGTRVAAAAFERVVFKRQSSNEAGELMTTNYPHVVYDEELQRYLVEDSNVPVQRLYAWHRRGTTFETLCKRYLKFSCAQILSALAFGYDNQEIMDRESQSEKTYDPSTQEKLFK